MNNEFDIMGEQGHEHRQIISRCAKNNYEMLVIALFNLYSA